MRETSNMRSGFTMIELIFVIVIIGILAAVAIPKLAATRDDAKISAEVANARTCLTDVKANYTARGDLSTLNSEACTNAALGDTVTAVVTATAGSEQVVIDGVPAALEAKINLNGTYTDFQGVRVSY